MGCLVCFVIQVLDGVSTIIISNGASTSPIRLSDMVSTIISDAISAPSIKLSNRVSTIIINDGVSSFSIRLLDGVFFVDILVFAAVSCRFALA